MSEFTEARAHAQEIEIQNGKRNEMYVEMEKMYWMDWDEEDSVTKQLKDVGPKVTRTPRARNAVLGAKRLLVATDPVITVPVDKNNVMARQVSEKVEKFLNAVYFACGRIAGNPIHYDAVLSGLLYSDVVIGISSTKEMLEHSKGTSKAVQRRLTQIQKRTPILFEVFNPKSCYAERDAMGLITFFRKVKVTAGYVLDHFGDQGRKALTSGSNKKVPERAHELVLCDYYDLEFRHVWLEGYEEPIISKPHNMPFIPVAYGVAEGSRLFEKPEEQHEPFLFTAWKSKLIERENLILTVMYTMIFTVGSNPMFVDFLHDPTKPHAVDYSVPGGTIHYRVGERREVMAKQVIDPAMMQGWEIANDLEMQSTLYRQALGEPISSSTPFSSYSLMTQSGRLPLIGTQKIVSHTLAEALEIALAWIKDEGGQTVQAQFEKVIAEIQPGEIPDIVDVAVKLDIDLPQDKLQAANAANMLTQGEKPLVSRRWSRENILAIGQSGDMTREIWDETIGDVLFKKFYLEQMAQIAQMEQMVMQPQGSMASGMPGGSPGIPPGAMPPNPGTPMQPPIPQGPPEVPPLPPVPPDLPQQQPFPEDLQMGEMNL